jgi:hypothetical protein
MKEVTKHLLSRWWYVILIILFLAGFFLIFFNPQLPCHMNKLSIRVRPETWSGFFGILLVSILITHVIVFSAVLLMRRLFELKDNDARKNLWPPALVGVCENVMYPMALFFGKPEFIGLWLAIKAAGQWNRWYPNPIQRRNSYLNEELVNEGRRKYTAFLVGNALSIIAACITWGALKMYASP